MTFSVALQHKISKILKQQSPIMLGNVAFSNQHILAPLAGITNPPFRLLMEQLGAGGTVSELVSCHGINYKNDKTLKMLYIDKDEKNVGLQLFGDDPETLAEAAVIAESYSPKFIDLNMGCPVPKVVKKGGGAALMAEPRKVQKILSTLKKRTSVPISIKIRTGINDKEILAPEIINIASNEGVEFVAFHGRSLKQAYRGLANWQLIEEIADKAKLPIIGNGDLISSEQLKERWKQTNCSALMVGRGVLKNPFLFLQAIDNENTIFDNLDYLEVINQLHQNYIAFFEREGLIEIQLKKHIVWFASGFPGAANFRRQIFESKATSQLLSITEDFFSKRIEK